MVAFMSNLLCCCNPKNHVDEEQNQVELSTYKTDLLEGHQMDSYLNQISQVCIEVFREPPYLYDGKIEDQRSYIQQTYIKAPSGMACILLDEQQVIGVALGCALKEAPSKFKEPFINQGYTIDHLFFWGELVLDSSYRGQKLGKKLYEQMAHKIKEKILPLFVFVQLSGLMIQATQQVINLSIHYGKV